MKRQAVIPAPPGSAAAPGVLEIKQARQISARLVSAPRNRVVCRFWTEKALLACDALQLYALLWQLSQPWPWPSRWLVLTRWTNAFNFDAFSFCATGAAMGSTSQPFSLWGEMPHYWQYALVFAALPGLLLLALRIFSAESMAQGPVNLLVRRIAWENMLLHVLYVLYLPVGLAVVRLINCDLDGHVSVDPASFASCWSTSHALAVGVVTFLLGGSFLVGYPLWVRRQISAVVFTPDTDEHERFVQSKELEYLLGTSNAYVELYMPLYASFQIHAILDPVHKCWFKLMLLIVFSPLRSSPPSQAHQGLQGTLFVAVLLIMALRQTWQSSYRLQSTNQLATRLLWLLVANGVIAALCANGVRSALTVSTSVFTSLSFVNVAALSTVALSIAQSARQWLHRHDLEPQLPYLLLCHHACWPTHPLMNSIIEYGMQLEEWVPLLQEADALALRAAIATPTLRPFHELGVALQRLEECWRAASDSGHLLSGQLHQELLLLTDQFVEALATSPFKDFAAFQAAAPEFVALAHRLRHRDNQQRLLRPTQRRILSKMQAERAWSRKQEQELDLDGRKLLILERVIDRELFQSEQELDQPNASLSVLC